MDNPAVANGSGHVEALHKIRHSVLVSTSGDETIGSSEYTKGRFIFHPPFGFHDYIKLKESASLSDSGTISEESSILDFPAATMRDFIERRSPNTGAIITSGLNSADALCC